MHNILCKQGAWVYPLWMRPILLQALAMYELGFRNTRSGFFLPASCTPSFPHLLTCSFLPFLAMYCCSHATSHECPDFCLTARLGCAWLVQTAALWRCEGLKKQGHACSRSPPLIWSLLTFQLTTPNLVDPQHSSITHTVLSTSVWLHCSYCPCDGLWFLTQRTIETSSL